jgi:hypothetical protein
MKTVIIDALKESDWDSWTRLHPNCGIFHSAAWANVLSKTYHHKATYVRLLQQGSVAMLLPMMEVDSTLKGVRGVSLPFTDMCEPLDFEQIKAVSVVEALRVLAKQSRWRYFEIRGSFKACGASQPSVEYFHHKLNLNGKVNVVFGRFAGSVRRAIRKAEKSGLTVSVARNKKVLMDFYRLHCRTRRRHGAPPQPWSFFLNIYDEIISKESGFVVVASDRAHPVAAAIFFNYRSRAIYKFGASIPDAYENRANNLVIWEGIKTLIGLGSQVLDFGRTSLFNEGLRQFKSRWGSFEERVGYYRYDASSGACLSSLDRSSGVHNVIFAKLPLTLNRIVGAILYPQLD